MAKFAGWVGYVTTEERTPGVHTPVVKKRWMQGDVLRAASVPQGAEKVNSDLTLQHRISLIGDSYLYSRYAYLKWVEYMGIKWSVTLMEFSKPRLIVTLGGVWNGNPETST